MYNVAFILRTFKEMKGLRVKLNKEVLDRFTGRRTSSHGPREDNQTSTTQQRLVLFKRVVKCFANVRFILRKCRKTLYIDIFTHSWMSCRLMTQSTYLSLIIEKIMIITMPQHYIFEHYNTIASFISDLYNTKASYIS